MSFQYSRANNTHKSLKEKKGTCSLPNCQQINENVGNSQMSKNRFLIDVTLATKSISQKQERLGENQEILLSGKNNISARKLSWCSKYYLIACMGSKQTGGHWIKCVRSEYYVIGLENVQVHRKTKQKSAS